MSGGGMGFIFDPGHKREGQTYLQELMSSTKRRLQNALPFAMEPVVYDFSINDCGTTAALLGGDDAFMPSDYYALCAPAWLRRNVRDMSVASRSEIERFASSCRTHPRLAGSVEMLFGRLFPRPVGESLGQVQLKTLLEENGFDPELHEQIRSDLRSGRIGLAQNRLPASTVIEDVRNADVLDPAAARHDRAVPRTGNDGPCRRRSGRAHPGCRGRKPLDPRGRRCQGPAPLLPLSRPLPEFHRDPSGQKPPRGRRVWIRRATRRLYKLLDARPDRPLLAGARSLRPRVGQAADNGRNAEKEQSADRGMEPQSAGRQLAEAPESPADSPSRATVPLVYLSRGRSVGLRMVPMPRDLRFAWEEMPQQVLDVQAQKVRESLHAALIAWAEGARGGSDYTDNLPLQCLHPVGHWFEVANLLRNGTLARLLADRPQLKYLMLHNIDTLGADLDPVLLGLHIEQGACLTFEVIARRIEDRGGGLARVDGRVRLLESLAMPREEEEFALTYYNTMTTWITIDRLLEVFGLDRGNLADEPAMAAAIRRLSLRMPTYITLKDVKKRWGHGQEDVFPVAQFEKLWGDMTAMAEVACRFVAVPRLRGQQLKEQAQLDSWFRDGSAAYVDGLCDWE